MDRAYTRGQPAAVSAAGSMLVHGVPHAILLVGPGGVGKTTLALDLAAGLLCLDPDPARRPCRACRGCRMVESGNHPDLHRLVPEGPGAQIGIGGADRPVRGVRDLVAELSLLPVEGGARVATVEAAHRLNEDAQSALLRTLEEPPAGVVIILCAEDEERLLPTIHSRCARIRLGPVGVRDIEALLGDLGLADAPAAARLARFAAGRPGVAIAYARALDAAIVRGEIARTLLDLLDAGRTRRLSTVRDLLARSSELAGLLEAGSVPVEGSVVPTIGVRVGRGGRGKGTTSRTRSAASGSPVPGAASVSVADPDGSPDAAPDPVEPGASVRIPPAERRRAAITLLEIWRDVVRDVALIGLGSETGGVRDLDLLDDLRAASRLLPPDRAAAFLERLARAGELVEGNVVPELVTDVLALAWRPLRPAG